MVRNKNQEQSPRQYNFFLNISFLGLRSKEKLITFYIPFYHTDTGCLSPSLPEKKLRENQAKFGMVGLPISATDKKHAEEAAEGKEIKCPRCEDGVYTSKGK